MLAYTSNIKSKSVNHNCILMKAKVAIHFNIGNLQIATALVCKPCYQEINSLPLGASSYEPG